MHVDPTPQDAPRPDVDAPTLHAAYAPPMSVRDTALAMGCDDATANDPRLTMEMLHLAQNHARANANPPAPSPTTDEGDE
jgi:hypothetical protein